MLMFARVDSWPGCARVCAHVCVCVCAFVRAHIRVFVRVRACVRVAGSECEWCLRHFINALVSGRREG